jgi:hypothetical protein
MPKKSSKKFVHQFELELELLRLVVARGMADRFTLSGVAPCKAATYCEPLERMAAAELVEEVGQPNAKTKRWEWFHRLTAAGKKAAESGVIPGDRPGPIMRDRDPTIYSVGVETSR